MSITVLNRKNLPTFSCERFYLLSELKQHAHSTNLLEPVGDDDETAATEGESMESFEPNRLRLPQFTILYLLWRPDQTMSAEEYLDRHVTPAVTMIQDQYKLVDSLKPAPNLKGTLASDASANASVEIDGEKEKVESTSLYIVVEKLNSTISDDSEKQEEEEEIGESLARQAAVRFRDDVEGITVGLSSHERAAPALQNCIEAVTYGSPHRRKYLEKYHKEANSRLCMVTPNPSHLLGIQDEQETDAAEGVWQVVLSAEWNRKGNLMSFAERAHARWLILFDFLAEATPLPTPGRSVKRKLKQSAVVSEKVDKLEEHFVNSAAILIIVAYTLFHVGTEMYRSILLLLNPQAWDDFIQMLRGF